MTLQAVDFAAELRKLKTSLVLWLEKNIIFICNSGSQGLLCGGCVLWICPLAVSLLDVCLWSARKSSRSFWVKPDSLEETSQILN